jgi:hypothetical protein
MAGNVAEFLTATTNVRKYPHNKRLAAHPNGAFKRNSLEVAETAFGYDSHNE